MSSLETSRNTLTNKSHPSPAHEPLSPGGWVRLCTIKVHRCRVKQTLPAKWAKQPVTNCGQPITIKLQVSFQSCLLQPHSLCMRNFQLLHTEELQWASCCERKCCSKEYSEKYHLGSFHLEADEIGDRFTKCPYGLLNTRTSSWVCLVHKLNSI